MSFKVYPNGHTAIKDLSLKIADGEFLVFVGPSGCGKSTALRMLAGLEDITAGKLLIGDRLVNEHSPQQRNIAMVFQNYALYPHMTGRQNMAFPLKMMGLSKAEQHQRVDAAAQKLGLTTLLDKRPKDMSGGQRQRVAMGRAIVRDPAVFLMDEPLSNLDAKMRVQIRTEIAELQNRLETTTVYVTHDQVEAMTMGDRVVVMRAGQLQQIAPPQDLYDCPANIFVAGFIGSPAMNIFQSQLDKTERGHLTLDLGDQSLVVDPAQLDRYQDWDQHLNQPILVGLRPEAFCVSDVPHVCTLQVKVTAVEVLGHEMILYFPVPVAKVKADDSHGEALTVAGTREGAEQSIFVARVPSRRDVHAGTPLTLGVDMSKLYLFNRQGDAIH